MFRRQEYQGEIIMLSDDDALPVDRPNLSKDYLAGSAPEEWVPFAMRASIPTTTSTFVSTRPSRRLTLARIKSGSPTERRSISIGFFWPPARRPLRPSIPGAKQSDVLVLRSLADCNAIIERAKTARRAVVLGASFIGLEVAAALRAREIEVHVVAPEERPMERILVPKWVNLCGRSMKSTA